MRIHIERHRVFILSSLLAFAGCASGASDEETAAPAARIRLGVEKADAPFQETPRAASLRSLHRGEDALLHAVPRADQRGYRTIIGRFEALSEPIAQLDDAQIFAETIELINEHHKLFGLKAPLDPTWLRLETVMPEEEYWTIEFSQRRGNIPVDEAGLTVTYYADGHLYSLVGQLEEAAPADLKFNLTPEEALATASKIFGGKLERTDAKTLVSPRGRQREVPADSIAFVDPGDKARVGLMHPALDRFTMAKIWRVETPEKNLIIDDQKAVVSLEYDPRPSYQTSACNVRHFDFLRGTDNKAEHVFIRDSNGAFFVGSVSDSITCAADDWFGNCPWQLKRTDVRNGLDRVQDNTGAESEVSLSCSSASAINFNSFSTGAGWQEQNAYFFGSQMRIMMEQNIYSRVAPNSTANIEYYVNATGGSHYDLFWHDAVIATADVDRFTALTHEQGHHAVWSYGMSYPGSCTDGVNEGERLHETFADIMMLIYTADDNAFVNMAYNGDPSDAALGSHRTGAGAQDDSNNCNASDVHNEGLGLSSAIWELLYNRDCSAGCATARGDALDIWTTTANQETTITNVGDAVAAALKNTPDDTTYEDIIAQMSARWVTRFGSTTASRAMAVIGHHGR